MRTFNLDEYVGLEGDDPGSYRHYMNEHLFDRVNIEPGNTFLPDGMAEDSAAEGERYEALIREQGGVDLAVLGIGTTGHIGFNEPLSSLGSRTRAKTLTPETRRQNARYFGDDPEQVPSQAITMGVGTILDSRRILMLATGESKAKIIAQAVEGPVTSMVTASALQLHPRCTVVVDEAAATELTHQEYYRWIFESETDWADYR